MNAVHPRPFWFTCTRRALELPCDYAARRGKQRSPAVLDSLFVFPGIYIVVSQLCACEKRSVFIPDLHIGSGTAIRAVPDFDLPCVLQPPRSHGDGRFSSSRSGLRQHYRRIRGVQETSETVPGSHETGRKAQAVSASTFGQFDWHCLGHLRKFVGRSEGPRG